VKQTREVRGGASRYEVEKTCKRNVPGEANPGEWTPRADDVEGTEIPWKAPRHWRRLVTEAGQSWSNSEGEWNLRRGCGQAVWFCPRSPDDDPRSEAARLVRVMLTLKGLR
jgi:hypothetical protein